MAGARAAEWRVRLALGVYIACFGYGATTHAADFVRIGWWPYRAGLPAMNLFWNLLVVLDAAVVALLLAGWRRAGLILAALVMILDVAINSYASFRLDMGGMGIALLLQSMFLGFILGSLPFLWPRGQALGLERLEDRARP